MKVTDRKLEILRHAARLFREKGYRAVSMRDLADALDIKASSLYNHIQSKEEILSSIILEVAEEYAKGMQRIQDENISSIDKLKKLITLHIQIASKNSNGMTIVQKDSMHLEKDLAYYKQLRSDYESNLHQLKKLNTLQIQNDSKNSNGMAIIQKDCMHLEEDLAYYKQLLRDYESKFHQIIEEGKANKELRSAHTETIAFNLLSTLNTLYLWIPKKSNLDVAQLKVELPLLLLSGIQED